MFPDYMYKQNSNEKERKKERSSKQEQGAFIVSIQAD